MNHPVNYIIFHTNGYIIIIIYINNYVHVLYIHVNLMYVRFQYYNTQSAFYTTYTHSVLTV